MTPHTNSVSECYYTGIHLIGYVLYIVPCKKGTSIVPNLRELNPTGSTNDDTPNGGNRPRC